LKYVITLLLLLISTTATAGVSDWNDRDKTLYASYVILNVVDTLQTLDLIDCHKDYYYHGIRCGVHETNPLWGDPPKRGTLLTVKMASVLLNTYLMDNMNDRDRKFTLRVINGVSLAIVINNHQKGLSWSYKF